MKWNSFAGKFHRKSHVFERSWKINLCLHCNSIVIKSINTVLSKKWLLILVMVCDWKFIIIILLLGVKLKQKCFNLCVCKVGIQQNKSEHDTLTACQISMRIWNKENLAHFDDAHSNRRGNGCGKFISIKVVLMPNYLSVCWCTIIIKCHPHSHLLCRHQWIERSRKTMGGVILHNQNLFIKLNCKCHHEYLRRQ